MKLKFLNKKASAFKVNCQPIKWEVSWKMKLGVKQQGGALAAKFAKDIFENKNSKNKKIRKSQK